MPGCRAWDCIAESVSSADLHSALCYELAEPATAKNNDWTENAMPGVVLYAFRGCTCGVACPRGEHEAP